MAASFEQLLDENLSTVIMKQGSLVTGIVIDILDNHVVVHVGLKSEAVVPVSEFYNESGELELEIGDEVQLTLKPLKMAMVILVYLGKRLLNKRYGRGLKTV